MKKQLFIINHYSGNKEVGMEYRHMYLSKYLKNNEYEVTIFSSSFSHLYISPPSFKGICKIENYKNYKQVWVKSNRYKGNNVFRLLNMLFFSINLFIVFFYKKFKKPDVVIGSVPHPFIILNMLFFKGFYKSKTIFEVRDIWPQMLIELKNLLTLVFKILEKLAYKYSDATVYLWYASKQYYVDREVSSNKLFFIPNGVEPEDKNFITTNEICNRVKALKKQNYFILAYAGSHGLANPLDQIISSAEILKYKARNIIIFMVGSGPDKSRAMDIAKNKKLDNIIWYDSISKDNIMGFYELVDVCFIGLKKLKLFKYGPTPNKLMDYMIASKPVIFSINSPINPVKLAKCGLVAKPDCGKSLATSIIRMSKLSKSELDQMGRKGRDYAIKNFSYKVLAQNYINIIKKI